MVIKFHIVDIFLQICQFYDLSSALACRVLSVKTDDRVLRIKVIFHQVFMALTFPINNRMLRLSKSISDVVCQIDRLIIFWKKLSLTKKLSFLFLTRNKALLRYYILNTIKMLTCLKISQNMLKHCKIRVESVDYIKYRTL